MQEKIVCDLEPLRLRMRRMGICVIIPTYNNAGTISNVVVRAKEQCDDVIVVNDGCTDNTLQLLSSIDGITIVTLPHNSGKGTALKQGFLKALQLGFTYAITLDGDGQHYPEDIPLLVDACRRHPGALIVGQRKGLEKVKRSGGSKFANAFSNFWFCVQTQQYLKDTQTGYRLYPLRRLHGLRFLASRYEAELELLVFSAWHGVKLVATEVNVYYPPREERVSHFRPFKDFGRITVLNTILCLLAVVYGLPLKVLRLLFVMLRTVYSLLFFLVFTLGIMTPAAFLILLAGGGGERTSWRLHRLLHFMAHFVMNVHGIPGVRYVLNNPVNETFDFPAVIICNHQSPLDLMPLLALSPKIVVVTNGRIWHNPFYGYVIRHAGFVPATDGMEQMLPKLQRMVAQGYSVAIYPEGTRSVDGSIGRFHSGAFYIARLLHLDIIALTLHGTCRVLPKHGKYMRRGTISMEVSERFTSTELSRFNTDRAAASWFRKWYMDRGE